MPARKLPEDYHKLAESRGVKWLGPEVANTQTRTWWECNKKHHWQSRYGSIQQGRRCPHCARQFPKSSDDYYALAEKRGFKWLGPEVSTTQIKTRWECEKGHRWKAPYRALQGCPYCANRVPKTPADYHVLAKKSGVAWIGPMVSKVTIKTWWGCEKNHRWEVSYNGIQQGRGCPHCVDMINGAPVSKVQRKLNEMLAGELNYPFNGYKIDIALLDEKIAVEYDCWYWHKDKLEHDAWRDIELMMAGWKILHVKSREKLPAPNQLNSAILRLRAGEKRINIVLDDWGG